VYFQGLSHREAAIAIGINSCTLTQRKKNAFAKLSFLLKSVG